MWMVGGYNESSHHHQLNLAPHDAFSGRKLRPLIPRQPVVSSTPCASTATTPSCNFSRYSGSDLFSLNHHLGVGGEQGSHKRDLNVGAPQVVVSTSRWNPTPEQLRTLEDLYRRGTRTPSTEQIQQITAELRRYGKIEGKNVFYWFQNHKARERQKRRRELELLTLDHHHHQPMIERKERGPVNCNAGFEAEQTRSYRNIASEESGVVSMQRAAAKASRRAAVSEQGRRDNTTGCFILLHDEREFPTPERNATWHHISSLSSFPPPPLLPISCISTTTPPPSSATHLLHDTAVPKTHRFVTSQKNLTADHTNKRGEDQEDDDVDEDEDDEGSATLQLFPMRSQVESEQEGEEEEDKLYGGGEGKERSDIHFFEFLPPKN